MDEEILIARKTAKEIVADFSILRMDINYLLKIVSAVRAIDMIKDEAEKQGITI